MAKNALPPIVMYGVDPARRVLSLMVFFAKTPPEKTKKLIEASVPGPFGGSLTWVDSALYVSTEEYPDADVMISYRPAAVAFANGEGASLDRAALRDEVRERFDYQASDNEWIAFENDAGAWLADCANHSKVFGAYTSAPLAVGGYAEAEQRGTKEVFPTLIPYLANIFRTTKPTGGKGVLLDNIAFGVADFALEKGNLNDASKKGLVDLASAVLDCKTACGPKYWLDMIVRPFDPKNRRLIPVKAAPVKPAPKKKSAKKAAKKAKAAPKKSTPAPKKKSAAKKSAKKATPAPKKKSAAKKAGATKAAPKKKAAKKSAPKKKSAKKK